MVLTTVPTTALTVRAEDGSSELSSTKTIDPTAPGTVTTSTDSVTTDTTSTDTTSTDTTSTDTTSTDTTSTDTTSTDTTSTDTTSTDSTVAGATTDTTDTTTTVTPDLSEDPGETTTVIETPVKIQAPMMFSTRAAQGIPVDVTFTPMEMVDEETVTGSAEDAEIVYTQRCYADGQLMKDWDLDFTVYPGKGRTLTKVIVKVGDKVFKEDTVTATVGAYTYHATVPKDKIFTFDTDGETIKETKAVEIMAVTTPTTYTMTIHDADSDEDYTVYEYKNSCVDSGNAISSDVSMTYGDTKDFALKIDTADKRLDKIMLGTVEVESEVIVQEDVRYHMFRIDPSDEKYELADAHVLNTAGDIDVSERDAYKLSLAVDSETIGAGKGATIAAPDAASGNVLNYDGTNFITNDEIAEDDAKLGTHSLRFKIAQEDNYKLTDVKAFVRTAEDIAASKIGTEVTVNKTSYEAANAFAGYNCSIALNEVPELTKNLTLTIYAEAELDTEKEKSVHTITFEGTDGEALSRIEVLGKGLASSSDTILDEDDDKVDVAKKNSLTTNTDYYQVEIKPSAGYEFSKGTSEKDDGGNPASPEDDLDVAGGIGKMAADKYIVNITETRKYQEVDESSATADTEYTSEKKISHELEAYNGTTAEKLVFALKDKDKRWSGKYDGTANERNYVVTKLTITVDVSVSDNDEEKTVIFQDNLVDDDKNSYAITSSGVGLDEEADNTNKATQTYYINKDQNLLTFTVTSAVEPEVHYGAGADVSAATTPAALTKDGNVYTCKIPAMNLDASGGNKNYILIDKKTDKKNITVKYTNGDLKASEEIMYSRNGTTAAAFTALGSDTDGDGKYEALVNGTANEVGGGQPNLGDKVSLTISPKDDVTISEVTWTMGEETGKAVIGKDGKAVIKDLVVKDHIVIDVNSTSPYYVVLSDITSGEVQADDPSTTLKKLEDGTYTVDYSEKDIKINLFKAGAGSATPFTDVVVKDGDLTAATKAVKDGNFAKITSIDADDWGSTLTIEVYKTKNEVYKATLKVSAASSAVSVVNTETGKVVAEGDPVSVMADSEIKFKINPVGGANLQDLAAQIRSTNENPNSADNAAAQALIENGNNLTIAADGTVTVQTKISDKAEGKVLLCVYNKNPGKDGKPNTAALQGGSITLDLVEPLVKNVKTIDVQELSATNRSVAVNVSAVLPEKTVKKPRTGKLYYIIKAANLNYTGEGKVTFKTGNDLVKVVPVPLDVDGNYAASSVTAFSGAIDLVSSYKDEKGADVDLSKKDIRGTISADIEVSLVQSKSTDPLSVSSPASAYVTGPTQKQTLSTKKAIYETKLSVKKMNSATVTTGQSNWVIASPQFKDASYHNVRVEWVNTKTGEAYSNLGGTAAIPGGVFTAGVNPNNDVWVSVASTFKINASNYNKELVKNLGVKIYAGAPEDSYAATAVVKLSVKQGIYKIQKDETKAALPDQIYVDAKGNAKSIKIATMLNEGIKDYKPAKTTLTFELTDSTGAKDGSTGLTDAMKAAMSGSKPQISVKNGALNIKGYKFDNSDNPNANKFYVNVKAADFAGNPVSIRNDADSANAPIAFTITQENQTIKELVVLDSLDKVVDQASLTAEMFKDGGLKIAAVKSDAANSSKVGATINNADLIPVTFKASGNTLKLAAINAENKARMTMVKPGKVKITATTVDGGKGNGTKVTTELNIKGYQNLGLKFVRADGVDSAPDVKSISYSGGSNERYRIYLQYYDGSEWKDETDYKNVKVAVKGGKLIQYKAWKKYDSVNEYGDLVVVSDKSGVATVTLTDSADKSKTPVVYTITNKTPSNVKAPSIKLVSPKKLAASNDPVDLEYQVKTDKALKNYAGKYVKLTPDYTVQRKDGITDAYNLLSSSGKIFRIDGDGKFVFKTMLAPATTYKVKMVATVGEMENGEFRAAAKDVKLNLSLSGKHDKNLKVDAKYTLNAMSASTAKVKVKTDENYTISNVMNVIKSKQGDDDHTNAFTDYFEIKRYKWDDVGSQYVGFTDDENTAHVNGVSSDPNYVAFSNNAVHPGYATIGLKSGLNLDKILEIQDPSHKEDCTGYITVDNGIYRKDIKITISFSKDAKLRADDPTIYASKAAVTIPITIMNGKEEVAVTSAAKVSGIAKAEVEGGKVKITTNANITSKTEVQIKVLPAATAYWANMKESEKGAKIDANKLLNQYGVTVSFKINVIDIAAKGILKPEVTNITLDSAKYDSAHGKINGYKQADAAGGIGYYTVDIPYTFTTANGAVATGNDAVKVDAAFAGVPNGKTTEKLINVVNLTNQAIYDAEGNDTGKTRNILKLTVSKKALELADAMDKKQKPVIGYGKKVNVPVTVRVTNGKDRDYKEETIKLTLNVPKKPMTMGQAWTALSEQGIGDVATRINLDADAAANTTAVLNALKADILKKAAQIVPADTDLAITVDSLKVREELADADVYDDVTDDGDQTKFMDRGVAVATIKMVDMKNGDGTKNHEEKIWEYALGYNVKPTSVSGTVADLKTAIVTIRDNGTLTFDKETTASGLEKEIAEAATVKAILEKRRGNISIKVVNFKKVVPTTGAVTITGTIKIKNLLLASDADEVIINKTIAQTSDKNFTTAVGAVKTAVGAGTAAASNTTLQAIVQKAAGQEQRVKDAILKEAKTEAGNSAISISYVEKDWTFTMATASAAGKVKFTLKMEYKGRISYVTSEAEIALGSQAKYVELGDKDKADSAVGKVKAAIEADTDGSTKYDDLTTAVQAAANEADVKKAIGALVGAVVGSANVTGATGLTVADGSIFGYKVDIVDSAFNYEAPTKKSKGSLSFSLKITSITDESVTDTITVPEGNVTIEAKGTTSSTNMTLDELKAEMDALGKGDGLGSSTNKFLVAAITNADTQPKALDVIKTALNTTTETKVIAASQTGELANVNATLTIEATEATTFAVATDNKSATITNVKVTAKKTTGTEVYSVVTDFVIGLAPVITVTITPVSPECDKGSTVDLTATVDIDGTEVQNPSIVWSVTTVGVASGTKFADTSVGTLSVDASETKSTVEVKAQYMVNGVEKKNGTKSVTVNTPTQPSP